MDYDDAKINFFYEPRDGTGDFFIQSLPWCQTLCLFSSFFSFLISVVIPGSEEAGETQDEDRGTEDG